MSIIRLYLLATSILVSTHILAQGNNNYIEIQPSNNKSGFSLIESYPKYPNGRLGLDTLFHENIDWSIFRKQEVQYIDLEFIVDIDGNLKDIKIQNHYNKNMEVEIMKTIFLMEDWLPAIQRGKSTKCLVRYLFKVPNSK